jgi:hypothetical protein
MARLPGPLATLLVVAALAACEPASYPTPDWALGVVPTPAPPVPGPPPPDPVSGALVGAYALTIALGPTCDTVPEAERTRAYAAAAALGPRGLYVFTLADGRFLSGPACTANVRGLGCHQFTASESGDTVRFHLEDLTGARGSHIVEQMGSGEWIEISGEAAGASSRTVIEASGVARVSYCRELSGFAGACRNFSSCAADLRMTLTRR